MNYSHSDETNSGYGAWLALNGIILVLMLLLVGPVALGIAVWSWWQPGRVRTFLDETFTKRLALLWTFALIIILLPLLIMGTVPLSLPLLWLLLIPCSPLLAALWRWLLMFSRFIKPKTLEESVQTWQENHQRDNVHLVQHARRDEEPPAQPGQLRLGRFLKGDIYVEDVGLKVSQNWLWLDARLLDQHIFVLGATGAGKSETLKRVIYEILASTDRNIYFVDGKGDETLANEIRSLAHQFGRGEAPVFRLGFGRNGAIYNGFKGYKMDVYNRLCALSGVREAEGNATYYADMIRDILQLICTEPVPRNFETVRARLSKRWLTQAYRGNEGEQNTVEGLQAEDIEGLARRIRPLARELASCVGDDGFALEDVKSAVFSLRTQSVGDTANRFLNFLMEDIKDFVGKRQTHPGLFVIDEFGQFNNESIRELLSLARSSQFGVVLATQDIANLRDPQVARLVLANTRTKILMATDFPEEVAMLAGTAYKIESSIQHQDGQPTGMGSSRVQHSFRVDMNEVARLRPGEAFVIRQRLASKILVRPIGEVRLIPEQPEMQRQIVQPVRAENSQAQAAETKRPKRRQKRSL